MALRDIIRIDAEKCNGCGQCVNACVEGAIRLVDGKARLVREDTCDGLGACLGECPVGAITIERREAPAFDAEAAHAKETGTASAREPDRKTAPVEPRPVGCPGRTVRTFSPAPGASPTDASATDGTSRLAHWPVQLRLVNPGHPAFQGCDLLVCADCVPVAVGDFQARLLADHSVVLACPKLDGDGGAAAKLAAILRQGRPRSVTVARMEVPCCGGLTRWVTAAVEEAGVTVPVRERVFGIRGEEREARWLVKPECELQRQFVCRRNQDARSISEKGTETLSPVTDDRAV